jgi:hypothetical protein
MPRDTTAFPNGVSDEGQTRRNGRTSVTGKATIPTGLDTVTGAVASLEAINAASKKGFVVSAVASATVGAVDVVVSDTTGAEANAAVFVAWMAYGPA